MYEDLLYEHFVCKQLWREQYLYEHCLVCLLTFGLHHHATDMNARAGWGHTAVLMNMERADMVVQRSLSLGVHAWCSRYSVGDFVVLRLRRLAWAIFRRQYCTSCVCVNVACLTQLECKYCSYEETVRRQFVCIMFWLVCIMYVTVYVSCMYHVCNSAFTCMASWVAVSICMYHVCNTNVEPATHEAHQAKHWLWKQTAAK